MEKLNLKVEKTDSGQRLDLFLAKSGPGHSRAFFQKLIKGDKVEINGKICNIPKTPLAENDQIKVEIPTEKSPELIAEKIDLPVLYEDSEMIVINKEPGTVVHPAAGNWTGTIVNALIGRDGSFAEGLSEEGLRPGIVHRLDKDTSGCLVIAKNSLSQHKISRCFSQRKVKKTYAALLRGHPHTLSGEIKTLIGRHPVNRKKMAVLKDRGREAISRYRIIKQGYIEGIPVSFAEIDILTGRTHQIRVHMAHIKAPVLGDMLYGGKQEINAPRQLLHAWKLSFPHPSDNREMKFEAPFPEDFQNFLDRIEESPQGG